MIDLAVVIIYIVIIFIVALYSQRGSVERALSDEEIVTDQYLASKSLTLVESIGSIIATEVSALTFLGIPGFAFSKDFSFLHLYFGAIIGRLLIARLIIPLIYDKGLTLYSIMGRERGTEQGKRVTALIYGITKLLAVGVRLYAGSILLAEFFNISMIIALLFITSLTFFYTLIGGLKAVVRTDLLQTVLFIVGGIAAHIIIPDIAGESWGSLWNIASRDGHTWVFSWDRIDLFLIGVTGGVLFDMCTHGVDQDFTQRLMGAKSLRVAQQSIFFSSFLSIFVGALFLGVGALLYSYYQLNPTPVGVGGDQIFAHFITEHFPSPLKGFMLAGVLAATMSTLDSTINALSSVVWSEVWPHRDVHQIKKYLRIDTAIISLLLLIVALFAMQFQGILVLGLKIASWSGGVLAALFFSQLIWPRWIRTPLDAPSVLIAYMGNLILLIVYVNIIGGPWQWNVYVGMFGATMALLVKRAFSKTS